MTQGAKTRGVGMNSDLVVQLGESAGRGLPILVDSAAKGTLLLLAALAAVQALRSASAGLRHLVWSLMMAALLLLPLLSVSLPAWRVLPTGFSGDSAVSQRTGFQEVGSNTTPPSSPVAGDDVFAAERRNFDEGLNPSEIFRPEMPATSETLLTVDVAEAAPDRIVAAPPAALSAVRDSAAAPNFPAILFALWFFGAALGLGGIVLGMWRLRQVLLCSEQLVNPLATRTLDDLRAAFGIRRDVRLLAGGERCMPMVWGLRRPCILLPSEAAEWPAERMRIVLAHELAHVKRWDALTQIVATATCAVYWFHPLVWLARHRLRTECEHASDDLVLATGARPSDYAEELLAISIGRTQMAGALTAIGMARSGRLQSRLESILDGDRNHRPLTRRATLIAGILLIALCVPVSMLQGRADADGPKSTTADKRAAGEEHSTNADQGIQRTDSPASAVSERTGPKVTAFGRVVDELGRPAPNVTVHLREWSNNRFSENPWATQRVGEEPQRLVVQDVFATAKTDQDGKFRFEDVASPAFKSERNDRPRWDVVAAAEGRAFAWQHLPLAKNDHEITLTLRPDETITGRVLDAAGAPIAGALVRTYQFGPLSNEISLRYNHPAKFDLGFSQLAPYAVTDEQGRFRLKHLPPDSRIDLHVEHQDYQEENAYAATTDVPQPDVEWSRRTADGERTVVRRKVHTGEVVVRLEPGYRIEGRVVFDDTGKPLPHARLHATWDGKWKFGKADAEGRFAITGFPAAEVTVRAEPLEGSSYRFGWGEFDLTSGRDAEQVEVRVPQGERVAGRVIAEDTGDRIAGVTVEYRLTSPPTPARSFYHAETTDAQGRFEFYVPPGEATVTIYGPVADYDVPSRAEAHLPQMRSEEENELARFTKQIDVKQRQTVDDLTFELSRGLVIRGEVVDAEGRPVAGAKVSTPRNSFQPDFTRSTETDRQGRFALSGFPPGQEQMLMATDAERRLVGSGTVQPGDQAKSAKEATLRISLLPAARITGRVLLEGEPLPGAAVRARAYIEVDGVRRTRTRIKQVTDKNGEYVLDLVMPRETFDLSVNRDDLDSRSTRPFELQPGEIRAMDDVDFQRLRGFVSGRVVDPDGRPIKDVVVHARLSERRMSDWQRSPFPETTDTTDQDGRFTIRNLPESTDVDLMAYIRPPAGVRRIRFPARLRSASGRTDVRIVLDPRLQELEK